MQGLKIICDFFGFFKDHKHSMPSGGTKPESRGRSLNQERSAKYNVEGSGEGAR